MLSGINRNLDEDQAITRDDRFGFGFSTPGLSFGGDSETGEGGFIIEAQARPAGPAPRPPAPPSRRPPRGAPLGEFIPNGRPPQPANDNGRGVEPARPNFFSLPRFVPDDRILVPLNPNRVFVDGNRIFIFPRDVFPDTRDRFEDLTVERDRILDVISELQRGIPADRLGPGEPTGFVVSLNDLSALNERVETLRMELLELGFVIAPDGVLEEVTPLNDPREFPDLLPLPEFPELPSNPLERPIEIPEFDPNLPAQPIPPFIIPPVTDPTPLPPAPIPLPHPNSDPLPPAPVPPEPAVDPEPVEGGRPGTPGLGDEGSPPIGDPGPFDPPTDPEDDGDTEDGDDTPDLQPEIEASAEDEAPEQSESDPAPEESEADSADINNAPTGGFGPLRRPVDDPELDSILDSNFGVENINGARVGNGGVADAVRFEEATGQLLSDTGHRQKAIDTRRRLLNYLRKVEQGPNPNSAGRTASARDVRYVKELIADLDDALGN